MLGDACDVVVLGAREVNTVGCGGRVGLSSVQCTLAHGRVLCLPQGQHQDEHVHVAWPVGGDDPGDDVCAQHLMRGLWLSPKTRRKIRIADLLSSSWEWPAKGLGSCVGVTCRSRRRAVRVCWLDLRGPVVTSASDVPDATSQAFGRQCDGQPTPGARWCGGLLGAGRVCEARRQGASWWAGRELGLGRGPRGTCWLCCE